MITTTAFREFLTGISGSPGAGIPSSKLYNDLLDSHYEKFKRDVSKLISEEHDEFYGVSCRFIDRNWNLRQIALLAQAKPDGHDSVSVAAVIDKELNARYNLDVKKVARFMISDTAAAARKVSKEFDTTLQTDCTMHVLNLCIAYGIGLKENSRSEYVKDPSTQQFVKTKSIVTEGGEFPEGGRLIRKLRALNNYFASGKSTERIARLTAVQEFHKLPVLSAMVDVDVRVASTIKLFQRSIVNYSAFRAFFQNHDVPSSEKDTFGCISPEEWELVVQMEAVMQRVAELALAEAQSASILSSTLYVVLRAASARMNSYKFSAYQLNGPRTSATNERNFARTEITLPQLSELAQRCIKRTVHQIAARLPKPSVPMGMALLLDPRTKTAAKNYLRVPDCAEAATEDILEKAKDLLRKEHRAMYKLMNATADSETNAMASASSTPQGDSSSASDDELDLLYGEEVSRPAQESAAKATLKA